MTTDIGSDDLHAVAIDAVRAALSAIQEVTARGGVDVETKLGEHDLVTTADRAAERAAVAVLRSRRPEDAILAEESGQYGGDSGVLWILDPLDGTGNYVAGRADYAVSLAAYRGAEPLAAVIHRPVDHQWLATSADGPVGSRPARPGAVRALAKALVSVGFPHDPDKRRSTLRLLEFVFPHVRDFRRIASASCDLMAVATGTLDAYVGMDIGRWDYAAGVALVQAAGGHVAELDLANGQHAVVAAAPGISEELVGLLRTVPAAWS
jgi:myo-inositol-1(or 4)-monophosphatase